MDINPNNSQIISVNHNLQQLTHSSSLPKLLIDRNRRTLQHFPFILDLQQLILSDDLNPWMKLSLLSIWMTSALKGNKWSQHVEYSHCFHWNFMIFMTWSFSFHIFTMMLRTTSVFSFHSLFTVLHQCSFTSLYSISFCWLFSNSSPLRIEGVLNTFHIHFWDENNSKPFSKHLKCINKMNQCNQKDFLSFHR